MISITTPISVEEMKRKLYARNHFYAAFRGLKSSKVLWVAFLTMKQRDAYIAVSRKPYTPVDLKPITS